MYKPYGLDLNIDMGEQALKILKKKGNYILTLPFLLTADTLSRTAFYISAILSNENSSLIFEEPETKIYSPFIETLVEQLIDSKTNQFFITSHNNYLLNTILNSPEKDVAVFIVDIDNYETTIHRLTPDEIDEIKNGNIDLFYNIEDYLA
jgi:AAA15 family ATPase/GTPase